MADSELSQLLKGDSDTVPAILYLDRTVASSDLEDAEEAIDGAVEFVAILSRVDGAVVLTSDLRVYGFGAEILAGNSNVNVSLARWARPRGKTAVDLERFGTRHRSALRYCAAHRNALAFVISEDGPVRAIRYWRDRVWLWDNVQLWDVRDWEPPNIPLPL